MATAQEFVKVAAAELGNGASKYNTGGQPWCAIFVNWCLRKVGYGKEGTAAASSFASFGVNHRAGDGYTPKVGDLLLVNYTGSWADHVAIVESYSSGALTTLNGNGTGRRVTRSVRSYNRTITVIEMSWGKGASSEDKPTFFTNTNEVVPLHPTLFDQPEMPRSDSVAVYIGLHDVTASIGTLSWSSSRLELAGSIDIELAKSDARFTYLYQAKKGDIVRIFTADEVFRGVIMAVDPSGKHSNKYTVVDAGWYLSKIKDTYQFNKVSADTAIRKMCADLSIPIVYMDDSLKDAEITGVYIDKVIPDIIKDMLQTAGGSWNMDFVPQGIRIYKIGAFIAEPRFRTSPNTMLRDSVAYRGNESITESIEDMKTAVKVVSDDRVLARERNSEAYQAYGFLQEVIKIDPEKENAESVLRSNLAALSCEKQTRSFDMLVEVSNFVRAGEVLPVDGANYVIESASHTLQKGRHSVNVELERIEIV